MNDPKAVLEPFFFTVLEDLVIFIFQAIVKMHEKRRPRFFNYLRIWGIYQQIFTYSTSTIETVEGVRHAQS